MTLEDDVRQWMARDPDPQTRRELEQLLERNDTEALSDRFSGWLQFGTAGLRGLLGAGPNRMNRLTVQQTTAGLCAWVQHHVPNATDRGICIGRDARSGSDAFARDVAAVAMGAGFRVWVFDEMVPTPVLAYAVRKKRAAAGVMITASHNPPKYNGYKVYWENGAQIIPPHDEGIADAIQQAAQADHIDQVSELDERRRELYQSIDPLSTDYVHQIVSLVSVSAEASPTATATDATKTSATAISTTVATSTAPTTTAMPATTRITKASEVPASSELPVIAYTALHGVGEHTLRQVLEAAGYSQVFSVAEQAEPDPEFPTVDFPNPEEKGAMDRVLALAEARCADLALANDPDADRLAVAVRHEGRYEMLSGNDIGILLAEHCLRRSEATRPAVLNTIVSTPLLAKVARDHDAYWEQTLTGHKWIQNRAIALEQQGYQVAFGYEEALGYAVCRDVRDKDGISAALLIADLAAKLKSEGKTLIDLRNALWQRHGVMLGRQVSVRFQGPGAPQQLTQGMAQLRSNAPSQLGGARVERVVDLLRRMKRRSDRSTPEDPLALLPPSDVVLFQLEGGHRAMVRPSGTEPKLKFYAYAAQSVGDQSLQAAVARCESQLDDIMVDLKTATRSS